MAKHHKPPEVEEVEPFEPTKEDDAVRPPNAADGVESAPEEPIDPRDAEIARLRAELAARTPSAPLVSPSGKYLVRVTDGPDWIVAAADGANALVAYKKAVGMTSSPHEFSATPVGDEVPVGRYVG